MAGRTPSDVECRDVLTRIRNRIDAIGALSRNPFRAAAADSVEADAHLAAIAEEKMASMGASGEAEGGKVRLDPSIADVHLSTWAAASLGLIVNALATNGLKYAFAGRDAGVLGLHRTAKDAGLAMGGQEMGGLEMAIWNDGPGNDPEARVDPGLGQKPVRAFVEPLGGTLAQDGRAAGTRPVLRIPRAEVTRRNG